LSTVTGKVASAATLPAGMDAFSSQIRWLIS
jgi:hypothetical protein